MRAILVILSFFVISHPISADSTGIDRLMKGNKRYVLGTPEHPNQTQERRKALVSKQAPFAIIVGCSDSRVAPEILFDQGVGDLFVVRIAGNVIGPLELESIKYAAHVLKPSVLLVLGHENCGAVDAVLQGHTEGVEELAQLIEPAVQEAKKQNPTKPLEAAIKANARRMRHQLTQNAALKNLDIYAGYFRLQTGAVELLDSIRAN